MEIAITKEVANAINTIKELCHKNTTACKNCIFDKGDYCVLNEAPENWPEIKVKSTYFIEVYKNE